MYLYWFNYSHSLLLQLKDMAERILAVDRAAAMVEEMLNQGQNIHPVSSAFQAAMANDTMVCLNYMVGL